MITTIIPTYQRPELLKRAIRSLQAQTYPHWRVCIYDNASGDETEEVVLDLIKKDSRISYYKHAENIGSIPNFAFGWSRVETPYFSFLSDDDFLLPHFFEEAMNLYQKYPEIGVAALNVISMNYDGSMNGISRSNNREEEVVKKGDAVLSLLAPGGACWTSFLFSKQVADQVGPYPVDHHFHDLLLQARMGAIAPVAFSPEVGAVYVMHRQSYSANTRVGTRLRDFKRLMEAIGQLENIPDAVVDRLRFILEESCWNWGLSALTRGDREGIRMARQVYAEIGTDPKKRHILSLIRMVPPGLNFLFEFLKKQRMQMRARNFWLDWNERLQWEQSQIERLTGCHPTSRVKR